MAPMPRSPDGGHEACRGRAIVPRLNLIEDPWEVPGETRLGLSHEPGEPTRNAMPVFARFVGPFAYSAICFRTIWADKGDQSESTMLHRAGSVPGATTAKFTFLRNAGPTQLQSHILYSPICLFLTAVVTGIGTGRMLAARPCALSAIPCGVCCPESVTQPKNGDSMRLPKGSRRDRQSTRSILPRRHLGPV